MASKRKDDYAWVDIAVEGIPASLIMSGFPQGSAQVVSDWGTDMWHSAGPGH